MNNEDVLVDLNLVSTKSSKSALFKKCLSCGYSLNIGKRSDLCDSCKETNVLREKEGFFYD